MPFMSLRLLDRLCMRRPNLAQAVTVNGPFLKCAKLVSEKGTSYHRRV